MNKFFIYTHNPISNKLKEYDMPFDYNVIIWKPSLSRIFPSKGFSFPFLFTWLYFLFSKFRIAGEYKVYLVYHNQTLVHHSFVTRKYFKFPFLNENDWQIGQIFTHQDHKKKELAIYIVNKIIEDLVEKEGNFYWLCSSENEASTKLAEKAGFIYSGIALQVNGKLGFKKFVLQSKDKDKNKDYSLITEKFGIEASEEQLNRIFQRYNFALNYAEGKNILEVACGSGIGLNYLAQKAKSIVGVDIDPKNVAFAIENSKSNDKITVQHMDAHCLEFPDQSFDLVLLFEAIYYLKNPDAFIAEAFRILKENGTLIICSVNKEWMSFHPSPFTHKYLSSKDLFSCLKNLFRKVNLYGGFKVLDDNSLVNIVKRIALLFHLIPNTLKGRAVIKKILSGKVNRISYKLFEENNYLDSPKEIPFDMLCYDYKILYAVAIK